LELRYDWTGNTPTTLVTSKHLAFLKVKVTNSSILIVDWKSQTVALIYLAENIVKGISQI